MTSQPAEKFYMQLACGLALMPLTACAGLKRVIRVG